MAQRVEQNARLIERDFGIRFEFNFRGTDFADERHAVAAIREFEEHGGVFLARVQMIGITGFNQFLRSFFVLLALLGLIHDLFVVIKAEPLHAFKKLVDRFLSRTFEVGILNAQQKGPLAVTGRQPVEDGGP